MDEQKHEHRYVFLRQEKKNIGYDRSPTWLYEDVFFCESCLEYRRVQVKKTQPHPYELSGEIEVLT